jgi:hypothetical protein
MVEILKDKYNEELLILAQYIILGSYILDYFINLFIVLIKYYIYSCRFSGQKTMCIRCSKYIKTHNTNNTIQTIQYNTIQTIQYNTIQTIQVILDALSIMCGASI